MKAITIWQPYASLFTAGVKHFETRGWYTNHRGPIAIHSGLRPMKWILKNCEAAAVDTAIETFGTEGFMALPVGKIVAIGELTACFKMTPENIARQDPREIAVGSWEPGRYAWKIENIRPLAEPIKALGKQGLWNWEACEYCRWNEVKGCAYCAGCGGHSFTEKTKGGRDNEMRGV